jgi:aminoglycoside 6'-N-acetyltransferase I
MQPDASVTTEIRMLDAGDEAILGSVATDVFDGALNPALVTEFLGDPRHHLAVALDRGQVVGFASAVHYVHPDKPAELWINEVGVAPGHQGRGIGKAIIRALLQHARRVGCRKAWVLTDRSNEAAMRLYASAGGEEASQDSVMFTFHLDAER